MGVLNHIDRRGFAGQRGGIDQRGQPSPTGIGIDARKRNIRIGDPEQVIKATSMLDASLRVNILNVLTDLRDELGMTILFITHDIGQANYIADQVLVMEHGLMVEQGPTDKVIFDPQHEYTRRLLSDVPRLTEQPA